MVGRGQCVKVAPLPAEVAPLPAEVAPHVAKGSAVEQKISNKQSDKQSIKQSQIDRDHCDISRLQSEPTISNKEANK